MPRKQKGTRHVLRLEGELCVRMFEAATGESRPAGRTAEEALSTVEPEIRDQIIAQARAAMLYVREEIEKLQGHRPVLH